MSDGTPVGKHVHPRMPRWQWRTWAFVLVVASIIAGLLFDALFGRIIPLRPEGIRDWLDGLGPWGPLVFVVFLTAAVVVSPVPSVPLDIAAGLTFGLFWGTVYVLIGAELGAIIAFLIARRLGRPRLARRLPAAAMASIDTLTARRGVRALILMRLLPVFNFDWVSYAAGLTSISVRAFALATFVGMIPPVVAIVAVGATLPGNPVLAGTILAILVLAVLIPLAMPGFARRGQVRDEG
ncbi:MAG: TVP38/TMEM64 family protein [Chloroflexia bacterium]|nr:TVP38/TMEM64 family protein [Chloroflexia bacterium]